MNPIVPNRFPIYRIREFFQKWVMPSIPWLGAAFFSFMLLQPHKFAVAEKESKAELLAVQEAVDELVQIAKKVGNDGQIQFDMLITLEGDDSTVSYSVAPDDTLSEIAKLFGTTSSAIAEANGIAVDAVLRVGQKLKIAYDNSIIYDIQEEISIEAFAKEYNIALEELMTLNFVEDTTTAMEVGQQIFVPLNRVEAQERGLIKKKEFVMLDLPRKTIEDAAPDLPAGETGQVVITAEDTQKHLEALVQAKKEAELAQAKAEELAKQAEEARIAAAQKEAEEARVAEAEAVKLEEQARKAKVEAEKKALILAKAEEEERARKIAQLEANERAIAESCSDVQCYHEGKCRGKPSHAICAPDDPDNAWVCTSGYVDTGNACITQAEHTKKSAQATAPKKKTGVLKQRYFNPYNDGYGGNGWAGGHCTMYVGWWIWKNLGKHTQRRGNAKHWYANASAAGWAVGQTPKIGSAIVMKYGSQGWNGYGHVGVVIDIDRASRQVLVEDMNYVGRYVVSQHWVDMDSSRNPVIGYIYP